MLGTRDGIEEAIDKANEANVGLLKEMIRDDDSLEEIIVAALDAIGEEKEKKSNGIDEEEEEEDGAEGVEGVEVKKEKKEKNKKLMEDFYFVIEHHCDVFYTEWNCLCILYEPEQQQDHTLFNAVRCLVGLYCVRRKFKFFATLDEYHKSKERQEDEEEKNQGNLWATS